MPATESAPRPAAPSRDEHAESALSCVEVLGRLAAIFAERRRQLADSVGLTDQQWQALEQVQTEHFMPSLFARERASSAAAVSKILRQLVDKKLVTAHVSEVDARQRAYVVTPRGQKLLAALRAERQHAIEEVWLSLAPDDLESFARIGSKVAGELEEYARRNQKAPSSRKKPTSD